jgi:hypothetical protein
MCMVICTFTNMNTNTCDQQKLYRFACPTSNYSLWISVLFLWYVFHTGKYVSVRGFSVAVNEIIVHMDTHLPHLVSIKMCLSVNDKCGGEYNIPWKVDILLLLICSISMH